MTRLLALLVLWTLPWRWEYWSDVGRMRIETGCDPQYVVGGLVAYYDGYRRVINLCPQRFSQLRHIVSHESQHHMQVVEKMALWPGGFEAFEQAVLYEIDHGEYPADVRRLIHVLAAAEEPICTYSELHAELPWILAGEIPASLQQWYPWFYRERTDAS